MLHTWITLSFLYLEDNFLTLPVFHLRKLREQLDAWKQNSMIFPFGASVHSGSRFSHLRLQEDRGTVNAGVSHTRSVYSRLRLNVTVQYIIYTHSYCTVHRRVPPARPATSAVHDD